jgi:hypothetical protein
MVVYHITSTAVSNLALLLEIVNVKIVKATNFHFTVII